VSAAGPRRRPGAGQSPPTPGGAGRSAAGGGCGGRFGAGRAAGRPAVPGKLRSPPLRVPLPQRSRARSAGGRSLPGLRSWLRVSRAGTGTQGPVFGSCRRRPSGLCVCVPVFAPSARPQKPAAMYCVQLWDPSIGRTWTCWSGARAGPRR